MMATQSKKGFIEEPIAERTRASLKNGCFSNNLSLHIEDLRKRKRSSSLNDTVSSSDSRQTQTNPNKETGTADLPIVLDTPVNAPLRNMMKRLPAEKAYLLNDMPLMSPYVNLEKRRMTTTAHVHKAPCLDMEDIACIPHIHSTPLGEIEDAHKAPWEDSEDIDCSAHVHKAPCVDIEDIACPDYKEEPIGKRTRSSLKRECGWLLDGRVYKTQWEDMTDYGTPSCKDMDRISLWKDMDLFETASLETRKALKQIKAEQFEMAVKRCIDFHAKNRWIHDVVPVRKDGKEMMLCYIPNDDTFHGNKPDVYREMKVIYRRLKTCSKESFLVEKKYGSRSKKPTIAETHKINKLVNTVTDNLMNKHSNITMIRMSQTKSIGFGTSDPIHRDEVCVVIYTRAKSYVPLGEPLFPEIVEASDGSKIKTDVREGYFLLCPNGKMNYSEPANEWQRELKLGQSIGPASNAASFSGTLGPFVSVEENNEEPYDAFLTASHLFFDRPSNISSVVDTKVNQPADDDEQTKHIAQNRRCGVVRQCILDDKSNVGMDVALVKIAEERRPTRALFSHVSDKHLKDAGFSKETFPTYDDGSVLNLKEINSNRRENGRAVKFGKRTGLTVGDLLPYVTTAAVEPFALPGYPKEKKYIMKGQLQINSPPDDMFFQAGDSGAAVFFADKDDNRLHFIGMAIGMTTDGYCLATPAQNLLDKLSETARVEIKTFITEANNMHAD